jgi:hypothetical protein
MANSTIRRNAALREIDIRENPDGTPRVFSVRFVKLDGETVYLPRAVASGSGINRNMKVLRERGFLPVDGRYHATGHVYPVNIDNILEFNNQKITL